MSQEQAPFSQTPEYNKAHIEFVEVLNNPNISLEDKLEKLEELADQIGANTNNAKHFNEDVLERLVKGKNQELYKAYMESLENLKDAA